MDNRPIGVFDSGIGGLTVVDALAETLPNESIVYVGDTARVPYGNKSSERVQQYAREITDWLIARDCKLIVVACNTVSSLALNQLHAEFNIPIIGVINPGVSTAIEETVNQRVGVLGTNATIRSDAYGKRLKASNGAMTVMSKACPLFVPLAEEGWVSGDVPRSIATTYLNPLVQSDVDTVILGCTHYPLLRPIIQEVLGPGVKLVDSGTATANAADNSLNQNNITADNTPGKIQCFATDSPQSFEVLAGRFVSTQISSIQHIDIS